MKKILLLVLILATNLRLIKLQGYLADHVAQLNATGVCTFCDLRYLKNSDLNPGLSITNLSGSDLSYSNLFGLDLKGSNLELVTWRNSNLKAINLSYAHLSNTTFQGSFLKKVKFKGAFLDYVSFKDVVFKRVDLRDLGAENNIVWPAGLNLLQPRSAFTGEVGENEKNVSDSDADSITLPDIDEV